MLSAFFCGVNITGDINNFVPIQFNLIKQKIVDILTNLFIPPVILKAQKIRFMNKYHKLI